MDVNYRWYDAVSKDIVVVEILSEWTWDDFAIMKREADALALSVSHAVYYIIDHSAVSSIPMGRQSAFSIFSDAVDKAPPNTVAVYLVGAPTIMATIFNILKRITLNALIQKISFVATFEEAVEQIRKLQDHSESNT